MTDEIDLSQEIDKERYETSKAWLYTIFSDISNTVNAVSTWRCPYKNVKDRCTAKFGCRNQRTGDLGDLPRCAGSDDLDYRSAWQL